MKVYIGHDPREQAAYDVAVSSLQAHSAGSDVVPLCLDRLASTGLLRRMMDARGRLYDLPSNAPCSTEFAISRFLVPILCQSGWALFTDCDVVFLSDVSELFALADNSKAVMVVKHSHEKPDGRVFKDEFGVNHGWEWDEGWYLIHSECDKCRAFGIRNHPDKKMDGQVQTHYLRKNWSSVVLWNCDHPANRRLSLQDVSERPGRDLHAFYWLHDSEIGELPAEWNWLVGVQPKPDNPKIAHFTLGGPFTPGWRGAEHDEIWLEASRGP